MNLRGARPAMEMVCCLCCQFKGGGRRSAGVAQRCTWWKASQRIELGSFISGFFRAKGEPTDAMVRVSPIVVHLSNRVIDDCQRLTNFCLYVGFTHWMMG